MLRYFIRDDKVEEVERLKAYYDERPKVKVDPEAYAEMGGYLADKGAAGNRRYLDDVPDVLFRALEVRADLPVIHYNLARYYRMVGDGAEERKALADGVLPLLRTDDMLTKQRMTIEIDAHTRLGQLDYREKAYLDAEKQFAAAIKLVEKYQGAGLLRRERIFGQPYADLGDLEYYIQGSLAEALANFTKAEANGFTDPLLDYKVGYIHYAGQRLGFIDQQVPRGGGWAQDAAAADEPAVRHRQRFLPEGGLLRRAGVLPAAARPGRHARIGHRHPAARAGVRAPVAHGDDGEGGQQPRRGDGQAGRPHG